MERPDVGGGNERARGMSGSGGNSGRARECPKCGAMVPAGHVRCLVCRLERSKMDAVEAERSGLVARVVPAASLMDEAMKTAEAIAALSLPSVMAAKEAVNAAHESSLAEGLRLERRLFHSLFATDDQKEGMKAFVEKRKPAWKQK